MGSKVDNLPLDIFTNTTSALVHNSIRLVRDGGGLIMFQELPFLKYSSTKARLVLNMSQQQ